MGLSVGQRRSLDEIEDSLRAADPQLASLFTIFTRLNRDEEMPRIEQLRAGAAGLWARLRIRSAAFGRRLTATPRARIRTAVFFPMALAAMTCTVLIGLGSSGSPRCLSVPRVVGTSQLSTKSRDKTRTKAGSKPKAGTKPSACGPALWPAGLTGR